jgi:hypothetical protein
MPKPEPTVLRISSPSDIITTVPRMLGFRPTNSVVVICASGERQRFGLVLRFDLDAAWDPEAFARAVEERVRFESADSYFILVYADDVEPFSDEDLPHLDVMACIVERLHDLDEGGWLVVGDQYWNYCPDPRCCPRGPMPVDDQTPGATAAAAAYTMLGRAVLPDRDALARSVAYDGDEVAKAMMTEWIDIARERLESVPQPDRQRALRALVIRLAGAIKDPRHSVDELDIAELVALCDDVIVRDEILVRALKPRRRDALELLLSAVARRVPPPEDAPICATLAWVAYANGHGAIANIALERALATDPDYSLAHIIAESLDRQIDPHHLEDVMRGAARDLKARREAG